MPELPEVETILRGLKKRIIGKKVISVNIHDTRVADSRIRSIVPFTITNITRRAKYLIFHTNTTYSLLCHLRMTGHFHYPLTASEHTASQKYLTVSFNFHDHTCLTHNSIRRLGFLRLITSDKLRSFLASLGPEPLSLTPLQFAAQLSLRPRRLIKSALMDPSIISGVGNIYAQEALYLSSIHPLARISCLNTSHLQSLHRNLRSILLRSIRLHGTSIKNYSHLSGRGSFQNHLKIYNQPRCPLSHPTKKLTIGGRGTTFCPACQHIGHKKLTGHKR